MRKLALLAAAASAAFVISTPAQAALVQINGGGTNGLFSGNDCNSGSPPNSFSDCFASSNGINVAGDNGSGVVFKVESGGSLTVSSNFAGLITGDDYTVNFNGSTHVLSFTYSPDAGDPVLHYFDIKQANGFALFYDSAGITSGSIDLDNYFGRQAGGFSHITFFDSQMPPPAVPEPATWAMMLAGFGATGFALRRRRRKSVFLTQAA